ncbi:MAG: AAA family ATPase [Verrucomicrobiota bacterium]
MRLLSIHLRNYRVHRNLEVSFDASRNLIGGPNESGKSTLAEAIHRTLFLRAKTGGALQKSLVSTHPGDPEVTLRFAARGTNWTLEKRFAGASRGSTRLTRDGGSTLKDDEADSMLAELLGIEISGRANAAQLSATWSHLWVWQGSSGEDPAIHASSHKDTLVQRLQQDGIAAVMQSTTDQAVREKIAATYDTLFTATGKPKAGSPPEVTRMRLAAAEESLQRATELAQKLDQAADAHTRASAEIAAASAALPALHAPRAVTAEKLIQVTDLRRLEQTQCESLESIATTREQLFQDHQRILSLQQQAATTSAALAPTEEKQASLAAAENAARHNSEASEAAHQSCIAKVRQARLHHDLALAAVSVFEKSAAHAQLATRAAEAEELRGQLSAVAARLSQLPILTAADLATLRKLDRDAGNAAAALDAMATGIELIDSNQPVTLDGKPLLPGDHPVLTDAGELTIGSGTRLRIRPGGGSTLAAARAAATKTNSDLTDLLSRLGLHHLDHASATLEQRQALDQQVARHQERWKALGGDSLSTALTAAATALDAARSEYGRRLALVDEAPAIAEDRYTAHLSICQDDLTRSEVAESSARSQSESAATALLTTTKAQQEHLAKVAVDHQALRDLQTRIAVLEETHGDATTRHAKLAHATAATQAADLDLTATRTALAQLDPGMLTADLDRLDRAIAQQETRLRDALTQRAVMQSQLMLDGSSDPRADLRHATGRRDAAREDFAAEQRHAAAIATLYQHFSTMGEAMARSLVQPLADRISGYLGCLFGAGAAVSLELADNGIAGIELVRPGDSAFSFATLSGGAREQVAAAARLAMAEILASDHEGCLPILFDDAFAYTDPDRVLRLQRMLDLAAVRGLQVIVLTCTPDDYSAFGAAPIPLA